MSFIEGLRVHTLSEWRKAGRLHVPVLIKEYMPSEFPPAGCALVWLLNGSGRLYTDYQRPLPEPHVERLFYQSALMLDGTDLIRWRNSECPTCPHLLEAAGLSAQEVAAADAAINGWTLSDMRDSKPREWVKAYLPLLSLCEPGFYWLFINDHRPTDGSGRFFWSDIPPDNPQDLLAFKWGAESEDPTFLLSTQQTSSFQVENWELARHTYETHPAVALFLRGYGSALLDGHHRATAAAVAGQSFPCVTFMEAAFGDACIEPPLPPWGMQRAAAAPPPEEVSDRTFLRSVSPGYHAPTTVQRDAPMQSPLPVAEEAQHGVSTMPTTNDWYYGVLLRHFFDGVLTEDQWRTLLEKHTVSSPTSPRRMETVIYPGDKETVEPSIHDLPLIGALIGLRVLDDPTWRRRWDEALNIPLDQIPPEHLGLSTHSQPTPIEMEFITELFARNELKHPDLIAELRQRYSLA
jgi:hypothetical protein